MFHVLSEACITALQSAKKGYKTLLMTTDPAAHLGNVLEKDIGSDITKIEDVENLYAVRIDQSIVALRTEVYLKLLFKF